MGRRGPPPKPTTLRLLEGNPSRRPINHAEPKPTAGATPPEPPSWLCDEAAVLFRRLAAELHRMGMITDVDVELLSVYAEAWASYRRAVLTLQVEGEYREQYGPNGSRTVAHPATRIRREAAADMRSISGKFGFSPSDRSQLMAGVGDPDAEDELARLVSESRKARESRGA